MISFLKKLLIISLAPLFLSSSVGAQTNIYQQLQTPFYDPGTSSASDCTPDNINLAGSDNIQKALNFLLSKNLTVNQASGIIGNLEQESGQGLNPLDQQNGSTSTVPIPNVGFGIAQWTTPSRQQALVAYAQQNSGQPSDLAMQLGFLWQELNDNYSGVLQNLEKSTTVPDAVNQFVGPKDTRGNPVPPTAEVQRTGGYENPGTPKMQNRLDYAQKVADTYGGSSNGSGISDCSSATVNCNSSSATQSTAALSPVRQSVVCIAQAELALWQSQPGYPRPAYSQTGYYKYSQNSPEEWCADFTSWVYDQAKYPLQPDPKWRVAAVRSIQAIGEQNGNFHWHPAGSYVPKPGDLAIHGPNHVNIFISSQGGKSLYIGGDQGSGPYPGGSIVSTESSTGYYSNGITGYVSPD